MDRRWNQEGEREHEEDFERLRFGNYGYYNPPYLKDTAYYGTMGNPFHTPYGDYKRFESPDYTRVMAGLSGRGAQGSYVGRGPRGYQRSDLSILEEINERLTQHGEIDASDLEFAVASGEVTLIGTVDSRGSKRLAEDIAASVSGVKDIHNQLKIGQLERI